MWYRNGLNLQIKGASGGIIASIADSLEAIDLKQYSALMIL